jgi:hypothetical protein
MVLLVRKLICCSFKFSFCFILISNFVLVFVALVENVPNLKQLLKDVFHKTLTSINLGFIVYICDAHKMLYFCNQNGIVTFVKVVHLVRFLVNTATFLKRTLGFWVSL